jgi:hypothetical protein
VTGAGDVETNAVGVLLGQSSITISRRGAIGTAAIEIPIATQDRTATCHVTRENLMACVQHGVKFETIKIHVPDGDDGSASLDVEFQQARYYLGTMSNPW